MIIHYNKGHNPICKIKPKLKVLTFDWFEVTCVNCLKFKPEFKYKPLPDTTWREVYPTDILSDENIKKTNRFWLIHEYDIFVRTGRKARR